MPTELIVYVDEKGQPTGETAPKLAAHHAETRLHLAFSCYVFNDLGEFLVTQRAHVKKVWPDVWTNSVCGHPMPNESLEHALVRRLDYELGMKAKDIKMILPKYLYKTPPYNGIIEHEFCPIFAARAISEPRPNPHEVDAYRWTSWEEYVNEIENDPDNKWSWWCKDQLRFLKNNELLKRYYQHD